MAVFNELLRICSKRNLLYWKISIYLIMKQPFHFVFLIASLVAILSCVVVSCSKAPLNEVDGSYFYRNNTRVEFEDKGYMIQDYFTGNISIACYSAPLIKGETRDCINILIPQSCYTLTNNRLTFRHSFDANIQFFTESGDRDKLIFGHLQQKRKVHLSGTITNDTGQDFFQLGNVYYSPVSVSFSLDDGSDIRLRMNTMTVVQDQGLHVVW
jgi:hypothetical protein